MDNLIFLEPLTPLTSHPPRLPGILTSTHASGASAASLSVRQTASQLNSQNKMWKDYTTKARDVSNLRRESHSSDRPCRSKSIQEQDSDSDNDLPDIDELLSGKMQQKISTAVGLDSDNDDGFVDIDEVLSSMKQENISATAIQNFGSVDKKVDDETPDGSTDSSRSTEGGIEDVIILSDNESGGTESETDYGSSDVDPIARGTSDSPHDAEHELADGGSFSSRTTLISDRLVADDHQADGSDNEDNGGVVDGPKLWFSADCSSSASFGHESVTHQASPLQVNNGINQGSTNYVDRDVTMELEGEGNDVFAKGGGDDDYNDEDARSTKRSRLSAVSCNDPASDSNLSVLELQDAQHDRAQPPRLGIARASPEQSDLTSDPLLRHRRRRDTAGNVRRKGPRTPAPIGLASTTPTTPAELEHIEPEESQSRALFAAPEQEIVDDRSIDDPDDEDYGTMRDTTSSKRGRRPSRPPKRVRWAKDTKENAVEAPSTHSLDVPHQVIAAAWPGNVQESEELPIHGYFTLKTIGSKVVYCLTFSQELLPRPQDGSQRQDITSDLEEAQSTAPVTDPNHQWEVRKIVGQRMVDGEMYYRVEWKDTWMPESELAGAKELVDAFMAKGGSGSGGRERSLKRSQQATGPPDVQGKEEPRKRRGRPRKQR